MNYTMERWNINKSSDLYGVSEWGGGYFFIAENGDMMVMPEPGAVDRAREHCRHFQRYPGARL